MTKLLINEPPLQVLPSLAKLVGLSEAIVLQQLHYESRRSKDDGWVQRSIVEWHARDFSFLGLRTVERAFTNLRGRRLILTDVVGVAGGGREVRMRVNMEVLEALEIPTKRSRQNGGTSDRQSGGTGPTKLAGPHTLKGEEEKTTTEKTPKPLAGAGDVSPGHDDPVQIVFDAWRGSTGHLAAVLDIARRRVIEKGLKSHGQDDLVDAVRGWRHSPHHRGENERRTVYNELKLLLRDAAQIEKFRDLERAHGGSIEEGTCPASIDEDLIRGWADVVVPDLRAAVDESTFDVWLAELHPHRRDGDTLVVGAPDGQAAWIQERFGALLRAVVGRDLKVVTCNRNTSTEGRAAA